MKVLDFHCTWICKNLDRTVEGLNPERRWNLCGKSRPGYLQYHRAADCCMKIQSFPKGPFRRRGGRESTQTPHIRGAQPWHSPSADRVRQSHVHFVRSQRIFAKGPLDGNGSLKSNQTLFLQKRQRRFKRLELLPQKLTSRRDDRLKPALGDQIRETVGPCTVIRDPPLATSHIMSGLHNIHAVIGHIFAHAKRPIPFGLGAVLHHKATKKHAGRTSTVPSRKLSTEE